jgi:transposase
VATVLPWKRATSKARWKCASAKPDAGRSRASQETLQQEILEIAPTVEDGEHGNRVALDPVHDAIGAQRASTRSALILESAAT